MPDNRSVAQSLVCGASAGLAVDLTLYPLDTYKTRLQSAQGFRAAGGFMKPYSGMGSVAVGSAPGSAVFFFAYEGVKRNVGDSTPLTHALAACVGEVLACTIRVPTDLIKQRAQANASLRILAIASDIVRTAGFRGLFRGYYSTVSRDVPFSLIQFPLWEALKKRAAAAEGKKECSPIVGAACGSVAGMVSAGLTTPLDVAKTRIMLSSHENRPTSVPATLATVYREGGIPRLFSGVLPRTFWMGIGGLIYFGAYEFTTSLAKEIR